MSHVQTIEEYISTFQNYYYQFYLGRDSNKLVYLNMFYNKYPTMGNKIT